MSNQEIADVFNLLSKLMEIHGENSFKAKSYSSAAFRIEKLGKEIDDMNDGEIRSIPGIGDSISKKIIEIKTTGVLSSLTELLQKTPQGIIDLLGIKGIGPKKIGQLWLQLDIQSVEDLEQACLENKLVTLKGFTEKTQDDILQKISFLRSNEGFYQWAKAEPFAVSIMQMLEQEFPIKKISFTGMYRRQMPVLDKIEFVTTIDKEQLKIYLSKKGKSVEIQNDITLVATDGESPQLFFFIVKEENFYEELLVTTGNTDFIEDFKNKFSIGSESTSEEEIFTRNNLPFIPPALRDNDWVIDAATNNKLPVLIEEKDVKGLIHCHSKWSDGKFTMEDMAKAAMEKGLEYMVLSDHSQSAFYANGLTPERILQQHLEVDDLNQKLAPFKIFKSLEVDILPNGKLDCADDILSRMDIVIASVHSILNMTEEKAMDRLLSAIRHPAVNILGHPTGRLLLMREGYPVNHEVLIKECVKHQVVIEINANPRRLDLDWTWIHFALEQGAMLSVNPDAHSITGIGDIRYGVLVAQKGGLTKERNLSSLNLEEFSQYVSTLHK